MGIINWLAGMANLGEQIAKPIDAVGKLYTTDKERLDAANKMLHVEQLTQAKQAEINKLLILTGKLFQSGWIPLLGWTCGALLVVYWLPQLLIANVVWGRECLQQHTVTPFPIPPDNLYNLVWLLFGFGGYNLISKKIN